MGSESGVQRVLGSGCVWGREWDYEVISEWLECWMERSEGGLMWKPEMVVVGF